mgnify:CR=1 FL=1
MYFFYVRNFLLVWMYKAFIPNYNRIHSAGTKSVVLIFGLLNHFLGAITILSRLGFNQTAHQAKELLGIAKGKMETYKDMATFLSAKRFTDDSLIVRSSLQELLDLLYKGKIDSFIIDSYLVCDLAR